MRTKLLALVALMATPALAQVQVQIGLPSIRFEVPPPLVVVTPGVQVVPDYDDEVFFVDGWYWVNRQDRWYRARDHRGGWVVVEPAIVPRPIVVLPRGKYKRWKVHGAGAVVPAGVPHGVDPRHHGHHGHGKHKDRGHGKHKDRGKGRK